MLRNLCINSASVDLIDYVLDFPDESFSKAMVMKEKGMSYATLRKAIVPLVEAKVIKILPTPHGDAYMIDRDSEVLKALFALDLLIVKNSPERRAVGTDVESKTEPQTGGVDEGNVQEGNREVGSV